MLAQVCGYEVGELIMSLGDCHIYKNHFDQVHEILTRAPYAAPTLSLDPTITDIDDFTMSSITLNNYQSHPALKAEMAV